MGDGLSRRDMIKGAAVAGAAAWTAPVILDSLTSPAAAGSACEPPGTMNTSGASAIFTIGAGSTVYWTWIANGTTTCASAPGIPDDSTFPSAVTACGGTVQVDTSNGVIYWNGSVPTYTPGGSVPCYFEATATGLKVNAAGVTAGVNVLAYVLHNGSFPTSCQTFGNNPNTGAFNGHWAIACGGACGSQAQCI
jgi:hypothetical protein